MSLCSSSEVIKLDNILVICRGNVSYGYGIFKPTNRDWKRKRRKKEFDKNKVPPYAYDLKEEGDTVSFKCSFNSFGEPIVKKGG